MADITIAPVQVDSSTQVSGLAGTGLCSQGAYKTSNGNLYVVLLTQNGPPWNVNVYRSTDRGVTWVQQDVANTPVSTQAAPVLYCQFDATSGVITMVFSVNTLTPATVHWYTFSTVTNTFTAAPYPNLTDVNINAGIPGIPFVVRADGTVLAVYCATTGNYGFRVNTGGVWGAFTSIKNVVAHTYISVQVLLDPATQTSHLIFNDRTGGVTTYFYTSINSANAVGAASSIGVSTPNDIFNLGLISGGTIYIPMVRGTANSRATILSGTPLTGPVWTFNDLDLEPGSSNITSTGVTVDGGSVIALWAFENNAGTINVIRKSVLSGGVWGAFTTYYDVNALPPNNVPLNQQFVSEVCPFSGSLGAVVTMLDPVFFAFAAFFMIGPAPPPPPPTNPPNSGGGTGIFIPRFAWFAQLNEHDICLSKEWRLYNQIDPLAMSCARKPDCFCHLDDDRPWVEPPPGFIPFNPDKAILLPSPAAINVVVFSFRVPIGMDGVILAQYHTYRGAGAFLDGSGDIIWRVRINGVNGRFLRDMGNMNVSLGSPQDLSPCPGGLWIYSGNLVEYLVNAPNLSGSLPLPGQGSIFAGLNGWFWPRI